MVSNVGREEVRVPLLGGGQSDTVRTVMIPFLKRARSSAMSYSANNCGTLSCSKGRAVILHTATAPAAVREVGHCLRTVPQRPTTVGPL